MFLFPIIFNTKIEVSRELDIPEDFNGGNV